MYDPSIGQWLEVDPTDVAAGDPNFRRYAGNDPTNAKDLSGLVENKLFIENQLTPAEKLFGQGRIPETVEWKSAAPDWGSAREQLGSRMEVIWHFPVVDLIREGDKVRTPLNIKVGKDIHLSGAELSGTLPNKSLDETKAVTREIMKDVEKKILDAQENKTPVKATQLLEWFEDAASKHGMKIATIVLPDTWIKWLNESDQNNPIKISPKLVNTQPKAKNDGPASGLGIDFSLKLNKTTTVTVTPALLSHDHKLGYSLGFVIKY